MDFYLHLERNVVKHKIKAEETQLHMAPLGTKGLQPAYVHRLEPTFPTSSISPCPSPPTHVQASQAGGKFIPPYTLALWPLL